MPLDTRIDNGQIYSGDAPGSSELPFAPGSSRSIGIRDGRIVLDVSADEPAQRVIDAAGLVVCPGFIDIHAHSDFASLYAPMALSKVLAGYTTELNGNCGYGAFPLFGQMKLARMDEYRPHGLHVDWETVDGYFRRCDNNPMALNQGVLLGQGTLRGSIVGLGDRPATRAHRQTMQRFVEQAMRIGCFGMSTGLIYAPGCYADRSEILTLAEVVASHHGLYASHIRSEGDRLVEALDEFLSVCKQAGCRAQYSHAKTAGSRNWHKLADVRRLLDEYQAAGLEIFADRYPYTASCTDLSAILLPNDALSGGLNAVVARLQDARIRCDLKQRIRERERLDAQGPGWFEKVMISTVSNPDLRPAEGKTLARWAEQAGTADPLDAALDLLIEDKAQTQGIHFSMSEENMKQILTWPDVMIGSDATIRDGVGAKCEDHPHPRAFGTPGRVLGQLTRDAGWFDLETAIYKLTGLPAHVMRLPDRGRIRDGYAADLVVFDPATVADRATYEDPAQPPEGIKWVFVNGTPTVATNGSPKPFPTCATPGQLLRFSG